YGWPDALGPNGPDRFQKPVLAFETIIVPTGCAFAGGALFFGDFHGDLHVVTLEGDRTRASSIDTAAHFDEGITDLEVGPDGLLYVSTAGSIERLSVGPVPTPSFSSPPAGPTGSPRQGGGLDP